MTDQELADRTFAVGKVDEGADEQARALADDPCPELDLLLDSIARRIARQVRVDMLDEQAESGQGQVTKAS